jgi:hypothetical protein
MAPINLAKLDEAKRAGKRMVGGLYRRIRPGVDGVKVQRAEIRFDDVARCLKIPTGGSSCQTIVIVESASVQSSTSSNCASSTRTGCRSAPSNVPQRRAAANLYPQSLLGRQIYWTALGEFDAAEEVRSIKRTASTLPPWSAFEPPSRTGYRRECGRVNPLAFVSPDHRLGRGLGYGEDLVFLDASLERFSLALDAIRAQPRIIRGLHSQHFIRADWFKRWRSAFIKLYELPDSEFLPGHYFYSQKTRSEKWLGQFRLSPSANDYRLTTDRR